MKYKIKIKYNHWNENDKTEIKCEDYIIHSSLLHLERINDTNEMLVIPFSSIKYFTVNEM
jgi:hypothetical protein